jgi:hypothetical protein
MTTPAAAGLDSDLEVVNGRGASRAGQRTPASSIGRRCVTSDANIPAAMGKKTYSRAPDNDLKCMLPAISLACPLPPPRPVPPARLSTSGAAGSSAATLLHRGCSCGCA